MSTPSPSKFQKVVSAPFRIVGYVILFPFLCIRSFMLWVFWPYAREIEIAVESRDRWKKVADNRYADLEVQKNEFERLRSSKHRLENKYQRLLIVKRQIQKELKK
jgi:hypothetical protein